MDISDDEIDCSANTEAKFVNEIIKAVLILDHSKKPFKQSDITGFLSSKPSRKMWSSIFVQTKKKLKEMGLELLETKSTSSKSFFLTSDLFPLPSMYKYAPENEVADRTLLILVLTFIFMRERPVSDGKSLLRRLSQPLL